MKHLFTLSIIFLCFSKTFAQKTILISEVLTTKQVSKLFPDSICKKLNINFPIFKIYEFQDKSGKYYCILSESRNEITTKKDTINNKIKAITVQLDNGLYRKLWEINDNIIQNENDEKSIWFWSKYIDFKDYDGDGLIDPVITYGTSASNGYDDGRIKFIIYYKRQKIAIRHQNGILDFDRETQVDKAFYKLPQTLQLAIMGKMELMMKNKHAIFPAGWQKAMNNRETKFNERNR